MGNTAPARVGERRAVGGSRDHLGGALVAARTQRRLPLTVVVNEAIGSSSSQARRRPALARIRSAWEGLTYDT